jgi:septum formation protein
MKYGVHAGGNFRMDFTHILCTIQPSTAWPKTCPVVRKRPDRLDKSTASTAFRGNVRFSQISVTGTKTVYPQGRPMHQPLILASGSAIRLQLLLGAGVEVTARPARIDEEAIRAALVAEQATPQDIADALAEMKARQQAGRHPEALVLGCDQVLEFRGEVWGKPESLQAARAQLQALRGQTHILRSAMVLYDAGQPVWRFVGTARLTMGAFSDAYLDGYLARNWDSVRGSVGGYKLEEEGVRLFSSVEGDYFTILGLPLIPLLRYLGQRGFIAT